MLVLARKLNQTILIGHDVEITLLAIDGNEVKLGIKAPREVSIVRQEVLQAVREENKRASHMPFAEAIKRTTVLPKMATSNCTIKETVLSTEA